MGCSSGVHKAIETIDWRQDELQGTVNTAGDVLMSIAIRSRDGGPGLISDQMRPRVSSADIPGVEVSCHKRFCWWLVMNESEVSSTESPWIENDFVDELLESGRVTSLYSKEQRPMMTDGS